MADSQKNEVYFFMNNLTTRKIVLGALITLVLAFSVQGTADAISRLTRSSGDLQTVIAGTDYQVRFSVTLQSPSRLPGYKPVPSRDESDPPVTVPAADRTNMFYDDDPDIEYIHGSTTVVDYAAAHYYDQESIAITVVGGGSIKRVGSHDFSGTSLTMYERTHAMYSTTSNPHERLSGSVTLTLTAPDPAAVVTITIDPTTDGPTGHTEPPDLVFTVYPVPGTSTGTPTLAGAGADGIDIASDFGGKRIDDLFTIDPNVPVTYQVEGSGRVYVRINDDREGRPTNKLETSSSAPVYLDMNRSSNRVTAWIRGTDANRASKRVTFINTYADPQITGGNNQRGATDGRLSELLEVTVKDANNRAIPGGVVVGFALGTGATGGMFIPVAGTTVYTDDSDALVTTAPTTLDALTVPATSTVPVPSTAIYVRTDSSGKAQTYFQLGSGAGSQRVTITLPGVGATYPNTFFRATATDVESTDAARIDKVSGDGQRADVDDPLDDPLVVIVKDIGGRIVEGAPVTFTTNGGDLSPPESGDPGAYTEPDPNPYTERYIVVSTDDTGQASVRYNVGDLPGAKEVFASIIANGRTRTETFNVNGRAATVRDDPADDEEIIRPPVTTRVPSSVSGTAGETETLTVTAAATARVTIGRFGDTFPSANASSVTQSGTTFTSTLTLPDQAGSYTLTVFVGNTPYPVSVSVAAAPVRTGTLTIEVARNGAPSTRLPVTVTATDSDGNTVSGVNVSFSISSTVGTFSPTSSTTDSGGIATTTLTLSGTAGATALVRATATDYNDRGGLRVTITGTAPPPPPPPLTTTRSEPGEPAYIDIYDGDGQSGPLNAQLRDALVVEVLDDDDNPVENVRVGFSVTQGSGRLSPRSVRTDDSGFAEVNFTPTSAGEVIVRARVAGVDEVEFTVTAGEPPASLIIVSGDNQPGNPGSRLTNALVVEVRDEDGDPIEGIPVTFAVTAGGGRLSETSVRANAQGRAQTSLTLGSERAVNSVQASVADLDPVTFNTSIDAVIHVAAANRPVMYWIDDGALYRLAGAQAEQIAPSANDVAVDAAAGKVYYIVGTSATTGRVHSVNIDGTGATVVKALTSVPMGLAHDSTSGKLYLTNSWGKIQRMNVDGTAFETNFIIGLTALRHIAVGDGKVYWTDAAGNVRYANVTGDKSPHNIVTGAGALGGIAASGNTVYWTEQTSSTTGRIRSANFNGAPAVAADLFTLTAVPHGIAVDGNTLYWANGWGKVQRRNIDRSKFQDVVTGLIAPGAIAVGGANVATPTTTTTPRQPTTVASKYDVNNDGTVDTTDVGIVVAAVLSGSQQASLDVNGDGKVDLSDVVAVSQNVNNSGAAAAPALRTRLSAVQVDRIQEQIDLLLGMNDRSPGALYTLAYLQNLLAMARPEKTQLLANYPNPFNPETWIPYELATDTNVKLTIYNAQGVVVRTLELGHQTAGYYTGRDRAAYWDGRNSFGELVASGLYFYQLETDKTSSMRKMVILK